MSLPEQPSEWFHTLGLGQVTQFIPLTAGGNSRAFRLRSGKQSFLFKCYRDRIRAGREFQVLQFLEARGFAQVPRPVAIHPHQPWALQEFVPGRQPRPADMTRGIQEALAWLAQLRDLGQVLLAPASDSFESGSSHLGNLNRRIEALKNLPQAIHLRERWRELHSLPLPSSPQPGERWLSPSDFGFHNALVRRDGRFCFFDLEYAGLDEPSKIVCDFFCQPQRPAPLQGWASFVALLPASAHQRLGWMWRVTTCKWACIILKPLGDAQPFGAARRDPQSQLKKLRWLEKRRRLVEGIIPLC